METGYSMTLWRAEDGDGWYYTLDAEYPQTQDEPEFNEAVYASATWSERDEVILAGKAAMTDWNLRHESGENLRPLWNL